MHEQVLPLVFDPRIPVAIEQPVKTRALTGFFSISSLCFLLAALLSAYGLSENSG